MKSKNIKTAYNVAEKVSPFKTQWNAENFAARYETNHLASLTIPDQTMSLRTIVDRFSRGLPIDGERVPVYNGEDLYLPDLKALDLAEQEDLMLANAERIRRIRESLQAKPIPKVVEPTPDPTNPKLPPPKEATPPKDGSEKQ